MNRIVCVAVLFFSMPSLACTTFLTQHNGKLLVGKSYDWNQEAALIVINKKGMEKRALNIVPGQTSVSWTSRFASLTFNQYGREMPNGGMNTKGLVVEIMWLNESRYPGMDSRPSISELQWIQYQLDNFSTTAQVVKNARKIRVSPVYAKVHYLVCDATADCAAFEYVEGKLVVENVAKVLTNNTYKASAKYLAGLGGKKPSGLQRTSLNRFANASIQASRGKMAPLQVLNMVRQGDFTKWQIVYDIKQRTVQFRTTSQAALKTVRLKAFDESCKSPVQLLDINTPLRGDVTRHFKPYTTDANAALIKITTGPIKRSLPPGAVWLLSRYPNLTTCSLK